MPIGQPIGHQHCQWLSDQFGRFVSEDFRDSRIGELNHAGGIDGDDGVGCGFHDRSVLPFGLQLSVLRLFPIVKVDNAAVPLGDPSVRIPGWQRA